MIEELAKMLTWGTYGKDVYQQWFKEKPELGLEDTIEGYALKYNLWLANKPVKTTKRLIDLSTEHLLNILIGGYVQDSPIYTMVIEYIIKSRQ